MSSLEKPNRPLYQQFGSNFLFAADGNDGGRGIYYGALDNRAVTRLPVVANSAAFFAKPDSLLFLQQSALVSVTFDPAQGLVSGEVATPKQLRLFLLGAWVALQDSPSQRREFSLTGWSVDRLRVGRIRRFRDLREVASVVG
ncbi:MAG: hypothetical protein Q7R30_13170 [Acidobacteriota bacterium]|nr:hypothetical protein [Acidobacteriota bacterium]